MEVLRGRQGTSFGRNAPAGVMNVRSIAPFPDRIEGHATTSCGTYPTSNVKGAVNLPLGDAWALRIAGRVQHRDTWVTNEIRDEKVEGHDGLVGRAQLRYRPTSDFDALLNLHGRDLKGSVRLFRVNIIRPGTNDLVAGFGTDRVFTDGPNTPSRGGIGSNLHVNWTTGPATLHSVTGFEKILDFCTCGDIDSGFGASFAPPLGTGFIPFAAQRGSIAFDS